VIKNERGVIVHGKNSWQFPNDVPQNLTSGSRIICRHEIQLDIGLGEYIFEIGLASISSENWNNRGKISHEVMTAGAVRRCHIPEAGSFSVGLAIVDGVGTLTHHGVANLPGDLTITAYATQSQE
jgi:lipopolysaccharide transport system ATP-binding protein